MRTRRGTPIGTTIAALSALLLSADIDAVRPNVLFLAVDDMKDWVNCLGGYEGTVHTPNINRLASRGTLFTNAHGASPKGAFTFNPDNYSWTHKKTGKVFQGGKSL
jgi:hypothetical protein